MNSKNKIRIESRQTEEKKKIIEMLKENPIVDFVCKKLGVGRSTYYRWYADDKEFAKAVDNSLIEGSSLMSSMAESQLLQLIKEKNLGAIMFWLRNKHPDYKQKLFQSALTLAQDEENNIYFELFGKLKPETEKLLEPKINDTNYDNTK
jgi:hypothetical protein